MTTDWLGTMETFYLSSKRVNEISMKTLLSCFPVNYDSGLSFEVVDTLLLDAFLSLQPVA